MHGPPAIEKVPTGVVLPKKVLSSSVLDVPPNLPGFVIAFDQYLADLLVIEGADAFLAVPRVNKTDDVIHDLVDSCRIV